jgi:hypothetical protein
MEALNTYLTIALRAFVNRTLNLLDAAMIMVINNRATFRQLLGCRRPGVSQ